jgi:WD40 repeat protein
MLRTVYFAALALSHPMAVFSPLGSEAVNDPENAIRLWEHERRGRFYWEYAEGHTQGVRWLAFAPEGETLASVSDDSTLRFWNVGTQQELLSILQLANPVRDLRFSPDGNYLAVNTLKGLQLLDGGILR